MSAYYNENDPFAVAWLRELIKAGLIAPGEVDERSILEVQPDDLAGFTQAHWFAGVGVWSYALRNAGWPDDSPVWTGSCPCQSFSQSGKRGGFGDPRHLWPAWFRLIRECRPDVCFGEQVASRDGLAWLDVVCADLEGEGYAVGAADLCAAGFGAPHIRQRLYFVAESGREQHRDARDERGLDGEATEARREAQSRAVQLQPLHDGEAGLMADAGWGVGFQEYGGSSRAQSDVKRGGEPGHAAVNGGGALNGQSRASNGRTESHRGSGVPDGLDTPEQPRLEGPDGYGDDGDGPGRDGAEEAGSVAPPGRIDLMGNAVGAGCEARDAESFRAAARPEQSTQPGPCNGFWRNAEWLPCRDGKLRPVESGVAPLVTGAPNRVGRLRGYGNSLTAPVAEGFVRAYMETRR